MTDQQFTALTQNLMLLNSNLLAIQREIQKLAKPQEGIGKKQ